MEISSFVKYLYPFLLFKMSEILGSVQTTFSKLKIQSSWVISPRFWSRWDCWVTGARYGLVDPDLTKDQDFHFNHQDFPGFRMDVHPDVFNSFPDGDSPFVLQQTNVIYKVIGALYNEVTDILACFYRNHWLLVMASLRRRQCLLARLIAMLSLRRWQCLLARLIAMCTG
jgi:hypothetical protein